MVIWQALESNPEAFNAFINKIGITGVEVVDIFSFDDECLPFYPTPQLAVVLCYPGGDPGAAAYRKSVKESIPTNTSNDENIFFMKQKIGNACGTFALFHSLANLEGAINMGDGAFRQFLDKAKTVGVEDRSDVLANDSALAVAHDETAASGETAQVDKPGYHFISYVAKDNILYEIAGSTGPRRIGPTTSDTLFKDVGAVVKELIKNISDPSFSALGIFGQ